MKSKLRHHPIWALAAALAGPPAAFAMGALAAALMLQPMPVAMPHVVSLDPQALSAKAAIIYDPESHAVLYQKNADVQLPLASLTKIMVAEVVLTQKTLDTPVRITAADLLPEGDWGFKPGQTYTLEQLFTYGLAVSSNDALAAAAASLGKNYIDIMNAEAVALGLTKTHFLNPTGLDITNTVAGAYGSAYDVARMTAAFYHDHPALFASTLTDSASIPEEGTLFVTDSTTEPILNVPGVVGAKTGYTDLAGGNLAVVFALDVGHPLVAVALGSTEEGRFADVKTLIAAARSAH